VVARPYVLDRNPDLRSRCHDFKVLGYRISSRTGNAISQSPGLISPPSRLAERSEGRKRYRCAWEDRVPRSAKQALGRVPSPRVPPTTTSSSATEPFVPSTPTLSPVSSIVIPTPPSFALGARISTPLICPYQFAKPRSARTLHFLSAGQLPPQGSHSC